MRNPRFWAYQFARTRTTREFLAWRGEDEWLKMAEVHWLLDESFGRTQVISRDHDASSGAARFYIRGGGQVVTLAEVMYHARSLCTCYDAYKFWIGLPILAFKADHSGKSGSRDKKKKARLGN